MMPRVLMFGWEFPPFNSGGLGVACFGLARALAKRGAPIKFVLPKEMPISYDFLEFLFADVACDAEVINSPLRAYITSDEYLRERRVKGDSIYGSTLFSEVDRYGEEGARIAQCTDFDVIHAHDWLAFSAGVHAKKASGKPLVVHVHATEFDRSGGESADGYVYCAERNGMHEADAVIAISKRTKDIIIQNYGIDPSKVHIVHNGIDADGLPNIDVSANDLYTLKKQGKKIVLFLGRITLQKGPEYFVRAAKRVLEYVPEAVFIVAGSGDMETAMIQESAELGIADKVLFTGFLRGDDAAAAYGAADLYVMPSVSEPFGLTPLESLLHDTPVLISKQSGVSEVLSHALKVDFWDIDEMANEIVSVLRHKSLHDTLAKNGRDEAEHQTWDTATEKCLNIYNHLCHQFVFTSKFTSRTA